MTSPGTFTFMPPAPFEAGAAPTASHRNASSMFQATAFTDILIAPQVPAALSSDTAKTTGMASGALGHEHALFGFKSRSFRSLPNEILDNIFAHLDSAPPSESTLYHEPVWGITSSDTQDLKSASLVCRRWRQAVLPHLFSHTCLIIDSPRFPKPITMDEYISLAEFVRTHNLKSSIKSFTLCVRTMAVALSTQDVSDFASNDFTPFWLKIFEALNPPQVTILCDPQVLGLLTECKVVTANSYRYNIPYHLLRLQRPLGSGPFAEYVPKDRTSLRREGQTTGLVPSLSSVLFEIRPWHSLFLNEGSFIRGYKMYDFHEYEPPSILPELIGDVYEGTHVALFPPTVRDFSYVAVFPSATHFHRVTQFFPRLDRMYSQFVPRDDILEDEDKMEHIDSNELWLERNSCYAYIMRELFSSPPQGNYRYLKVFESGDAADADAWEMAVEYVKRAGGGWVVERPGVFNKEEDEEDSQTGVDANGPGSMEEVNEQPSLFQGQLRRWAFTGVTTLPISSLSLYFRPQGWGNE